MFQSIGEKLSADKGADFGSATISPAYSEVTICWIPFGPDYCLVSDRNDLQKIDDSGKFVARSYGSNLVVYLGSDRYGHANLVSAGSGLLDQALLVETQINLGGGIYHFDRTSGLIEVSGTSIKYGPVRDGLLPNIIRALNSFKEVS